MKHIREDLRSIKQLTDAADKVEKKFRKIARLNKRPYKNVKKSLAYSRDYVEYYKALRNEINPLMPAEYRALKFPTIVTVTADKNNPAMIKAELENGTVIYEQEGVEGLVSKAKEYRAAELAWTYDSSVAEHIQNTDIFGFNIRSSKTDKKLTLPDGALKAAQAIEPVLSMIEWVRTYKKWVKDPNNIYYSERIIREHPVMWMLDGKGNFCSLISPEISHHIMLNRLGKPVHLFEAGEAIRPERIEHYHSVDLDVYSKTYKKGLNKLASKIVKKWTWDGFERNSTK